MYPDQREQLSTINQNPHSPVQYNPLQMVRDGYYYGAVLLAAAVLVGWLTTPVWAVIPVLLAAFFLWFFRDPDRVIPSESGAVVSPADGKVTSVATVKVNGETFKSISIFLNVFNVHVNRSPVSGVIRGARYQAGKFLNAMNPASAEQNEQNTVTIEGEGQRVIFKQIAGLLARRIVFTQKDRRHRQARRTRGPDQIWIENRRAARCLRRGRG